MQSSWLRFYPYLTMHQLSVSSAGLAAILGLSQRTIYHRLHTTGDMPTVIRLGRLPRFAAPDVHVLLDAKRNANAALIGQVSKPARSRGQSTKAPQMGQHQTGSGV